MGSRRLEPMRELGQLNSAECGSLKAVRRLLRSHLDVGPACNPPQYRALAAVTPGKAHLARQCFPGRLLVNSEISRRDGQCRSTGRVEDLQARPGKVLSFADSVRPLDHAAQSVSARELSRVLI